MLHRDVFVLELLGNALRRREQLGEAAAGIELLPACAGDLGQPVDLPLDLPGQDLYVQAHIGQQPGHQALPLAQERQMQVLALQLLLPVLNGDGLAVRHSGLGVLGVLVKIHGVCLLRLV